MYKLVYVNWYMFYTNSHKRTVLYQFVYMNWYICVSWTKIKKTAKSKKRGLPLDPRYVGTCTIDTEKLRRIQKSLAGNVGVVSGIFSPQTGRHTDMSASCCRHDTDHVGDMA